MSRPALPAAAFLALLAPAAAGPLSLLDGEFAASAEVLSRVTVMVKAEGAPPAVPGSSGVVVHPDGYVLSDADAALTRIEGGRKVYAAKATVRFPDGKAYPAAVLRRDEGTDSSLLKIEGAGEARFKFLKPGSSDEVGSGSWAMLCGNAFGTANEGKPAVSLGVICGALARDPADGAGRHAQLMTSAAVNPGSNGGPCADAEGRLVGIVSTWGSQLTSPWYGLGVVTPLNRIRERYKDLPDFARVFPDPKTLPPRARSAAALEEAFRLVARRAAPSVVSIRFERDAGAARTEVVNVPNRPPVQVRIYDGPVSGVIYSGDGEIVTATYNLWAPEAIRGAEVVLKDGRRLPARLMGRDQVRGITLLKVEAKDLPVLPHAPADRLQVGQFAFALGNPGGERQEPEPFFTFGVLSAMHQLDKNRDALQTDAGMNDANAGGALVDLRGRLLGINTLQLPSRFGRNSGIGFAIPVARVEASLALLRQGKNVIPGALGVQLQEGGDKKVLIAGVVPGGAADRGGAKAGDVIATLEGQAVDSVEQLKDLLDALMAGDEVTLKVIRGGQEVELKLTLMPRSG